VAGSYTDAATSSKSKVAGSYTDTAACFLSVVWQDFYSEAVIAAVRLSR